MQRRTGRTVHGISNARGLAPRDSELLSPLFQQSRAPPAPSTDHYKTMIPPFGV